MKKAIFALCALAAFCSSGAAKWKNLNDKSYISGDKITEADLLGNVVLVYYWDTADENSVKILPEIEKIWSSFKTKKFRLVGTYVGVRDDAKVKSLIEKNKVTFPVYYKFSLDPDPKVGFAKTPYFNVVNHRGVSVFGKGPSASAETSSSRSSRALPDSSSSERTSPT